MRGRCRDARSVCRHGFFRENMFTLSDGLFESHRPETGRRRQDNNIGQRDRLFVRIEPDKLALRWHVHPVFVLLGKRSEAAFEMVFENVGHRDKF